MPQNILSRIIFTLLFLFGSLFSIKSQEHVIKSNFLPEKDTILIFAPEKKESIEKVVYLLHGWNGNYRQWNKIVDLQKMANEKDILFVCPDGLKDSWYFDAVLADDEMNYATFFVEDLIPYVDSLYNTTKTGRFIGGLSMGGYGAFYIYLKNHELFEAAISSSGAFDFSMPEMRNYGIEKRLGDYKENKQIWHRMSMINQMKAADMSEKHQFYMDCGKSDPFLKSNRELHQYLQSTPAKVRYLEINGGHNTEYWKKSLSIQMMMI